MGGIEEIKVNLKDEHNKDNIETNLQEIFE